MNPSTEITYVSEETVAELLTSAEVQAVVENTFISMSESKARNFPVVREQLGYKDAIYGFKSGFDAENNILGVKAGGYWPQNGLINLPNHQSTVLLFDPDSGRLKALVAGNRLTAFRTAASSAISIKYLARQDSTKLGILGAGGQAPFQVEAALRQRDFKQLLISDLDSERANQLSATFENSNLRVDCVPAEQMVRDSDVVITITPSFKPIVESEWVSPGTHFACMGADTEGKQEIETDIVVNAQLFTDEIVQSIKIGEFQHASNAGSISTEQITPIGRVISNADTGRKSPDEITVFDGTGVALQDLVAAKLAWDRFLEIS